MGFEELKKKTFGVKNEEWISICWVNALAICYCGTFLTLGIEGIFLVFYGNSSAQQETTFREWFFVFNICICPAMYMVFVVILDESYEEELTNVDYRNSAIKISLINLFMIVFEFNPIMLEYQKDSIVVNDVLKYTYIYKSITVPCFLLMSTFATWILWRMSKIKPDYYGDEPYKVIYGGEDSSTKKTDECILLI